MTGDDLRGYGGGAADESGGQYRRALAALFVAHALNGLDFQGLPLGGPAATVETVALETDAAVDDILVALRGGRLFVQAKRTLHFGRPLDEAAGQWLLAVRDADFDPERDFVAAIGGSVSSPVAALGHALDRLRLGATSLTRLEREGIEKLRALLTRLSATEDETALILGRAVILERAVEEDADEHAERGRLLLDQHVVKKGEGGRAWRELVAIAGRAARLRVGHTVAGWLGELRKAGLQLTADAEASRAAEVERRRCALGRYRRRLGQRGQVVDLTPLGARLAPIPLADIDAGIDVRDPADSERTAHKLLWAFRRRGRVILTGLPGGGKSTAITAAAGDWAGRDHWAVPIVVSLRRLAEKERFRKRPLHDGILDLACEIAEPSDRALVRDALEAALREGEAALFLDGLDEAADRSLDLAADLAELLDELHPDTDVLLATRDAAYANAEILRFRSLVVSAPREPGRAVGAVLRAIASQRSVSDASSWVARRVEWVDRALALDRHLAETPLLPVLLALLAADSETDALPQTRARILAGVIDDVVRRHEIKRETGLAFLPEGYAEDALIGAFPLIAAALEAAGGSAPRTVIAEALVPYLRDQWGLAPEPARTTALAVLRFWDESGIFVARGRDRITGARLQIFLEIGTALDAASRPPGGAGGFVERWSPREDRRETLILAAELSPAIANALIERAAVDGDERLALAATAALSQGGRASEEHVRRLIVQLKTLVALGGDEAWRTYTTLVRLPVPADLQDEVIAALSVFGREHVAVGSALAALEWGFVGERRDRALEDTLRVNRLPRLPSREPRTTRNATVADLMADQAFMWVKERASELLLPPRPDLAPLVAASLDHAPIALADRLMEILERNGHGKLATEWVKDTLSPESIARQARLTADIDVKVETMLDTIAALAAPTTVTKSQQRRLEDLATFVNALNLNYGAAWLKGLEQLREPWFRLVAALGAFDVAVLAAEAGIVRSELTGNDTRYAAFFSLFDSPQHVTLDRWSAVPEPAAGRQLAVLLLRGPWAIAGVAARVLATHPERAETAEIVRAALHTLPRTSKRPAVWALLKLADDVDQVSAELAGNPDAAVREAVASFVSLTDASRPTALGVVLATDRERTVQIAAIENFKEAVEAPTAELISLVERLAAESPQPFGCPHCGTVNNAERDSCASCNVVTAKPNQKALELLAKLRPRGPETDAHV